MTSPADYTVHYPDFPLPEAGEVTAIGDGIYWVRMALPFALDHINLYLLEDTDGWLIVDTGVGGKATQENWEAVFAKHLGGKPVTKVLVTHMHPDHIGQAGYLTERWRAPLLISRTEYLMARTLTSKPAETNRWQQQEHYQRSGLASEKVEQLLARSSGFGRATTPVPHTYLRLQQGQTLTINGKPWQVKVGHGHSPEHVCLYCEELQVLISGDQILPAITPNISVSAIEPEENPLRDYLESLRPFAELPADTLVLPAHNRPFTGLHQRLNYLHDHHQEKLSALMIACQQPQTAADLLPVMFRRELHDSQIRLALGECIAHLNYLLVEGKLERKLTDELYLYHALVEETLDVNGVSADTDDELVLQV